MTTACVRLDTTCGLGHNLGSLTETGGLLMAQAPRQQPPEREQFELGEALDGAGLTQVLRGFRSGRQSGVLHFGYEGATKRVYFKNGDIVFASSDVDAERIGEMLVRSGKLKRSELDLACKIRETSELRLGKTVVEMGYMSETELDSLLKSQVESIVTSLMPWQAGSYRTEFRDNPLEAHDVDLLRADISTENLLLQMVRKVDDSAAIRSGIGDLTQPLRFARDPAWVGTHLALTTEEGFVLSRVDGKFSASEIAKLSPMGEDETLRCICALVVSGVLKLESTRKHQPPPPEPVSPPPPPSAPPQAAPPQPPPQRAQSWNSRSAPAPAREPESPPPLAVAEQPEVMSPEARQFREEMLRRHQTAHEVTFYELLDIAPSATAVEVKAGYFRLAKRLHPDHRAGLKIDDPEGVFDDLYLAVKAAYEVLSSESERRRYDFSLEKIRKATRPAIAAEPPPSSYASTVRKPKVQPAPASGLPARTYDASQMARLHFANGQRYFNESRFHEAVEELQDAVRLDGGRAEYHRLLGHALGKNLKWRRRAETHFLKALEIDRFDIDTMLSLGEMYESGGMEQRARKMYEEALGLDPGNRRAIAKLGGGPRDGAFEKLRGMLHRKDH